MPRAPAPLPKRITLYWGLDRLIVEDPAWIAKIVREMLENSKDSERIGLYRNAVYSRREEQIQEGLRAFGLGPGLRDPAGPRMQIGYQAPALQGPVAAEALKLFLGLELPVALHQRSTWGRSEGRVTAVHVAIRSCHSYSLFEDELKVCLVFNGFQLYSTHHLGQELVRPFRSESRCYIERRLLDAKWVRWGFDGASSPQAGRRWGWGERIYYFTGNGVERVNSTDSDLQPVYEDHDPDGIEGDEHQKSQGAV